eukprot:TRINITY_DN4984_c0_g2_i1.p1 TRINITY_DN4984_c0_g2~~TRINITY_DN4984_c0_g2_i1.p1  ORF type:complete len:527 (-),score=131.00 TRINITY_DN4984_c0_g2_i1:87-1589(-)
MAALATTAQATWKDLVARFQEAPTAVKVSCAAVGAATLLVIVRKSTEKRNPKAPPRYNPGLPWIGGTLAFLKDPLVFIANGYKAKGGVFEMNIVTKKFCFLVGPEAHVPFYNNRESVLDQAELYKFSVPVFGPKVVFDVEWPVRKQQLGFLRDRFAMKHMDGYVVTVENEAKALFEDLIKAGKPINIRHEAFELLMRTTTACLMGQEVRAALKDGVAEYLEHLEQGMQSYSVFAPYAPTIRHRLRDQARKKLGELFEPLIEERRKRSVGKTADATLIDKLIHATYSPGGEHLTHTEITGLCIAAFFGGMHNSAISTAWTLLYVYHNRDYLPRLLKEQEDAIKHLGPGEPMDYKCLGNMPFLKACVKEALRLRPPLVLLMRTLKAPISVCGYDIEPGTVVATCPPVSHRIEAIYEDCESFKPERWLEKPESSLPEHSFIAFGDGPRRCLGEHFGFLQVMTTVSHVLRSYDLEMLGSLPKGEFQGMVVGPEGDCLANLKRRS